MLWSSSGAKKELASYALGHGTQRGQRLSTGPATDGTLGVIWTLFCSNGTLEMETVLGLLVWNLEVITALIALWGQPHLLSCSPFVIL